MGENKEGQTSALINGWGDHADAKGSRRPCGNNFRETLPHGLGEHFGAMSK